LYLSGGNHFGLKRTFEALLKQRENIRNDDSVCFLINIDELPLSKNIEGLIL